MATPYTTLLRKFNDYITDDEADKIELSVKRKYLRNAISYYIATIGRITPDHESQEIKEDLDEVQMLLISLLMYDAYLDQEIIRYNKVINISNEFMKMTGATMRVKTLRDMKDYNEVRINSILSSLI